MFSWIILGTDCVFYTGSHKGTGIKPLKWTVNKEQRLYQICACKYSQDPPFCDATHTNLPCQVLERQEVCPQRQDNHHSNSKLCTGCGWVPDFWCVHTNLTSVPECDIYDTNLTSVLKCDIYVIVSFMEFRISVMHLCFNVWIYIILHTYGKQNIRILSWLNISLPKAVIWKCDFHSEVHMGVKIFFSLSQLV
jgi:CDGSH-type Zn-finger protein